MHYRGIIRDELASINAEGSWPYLFNLDLNKMQKKARELSALPAAEPWRHATFQDSNHVIRTTVSVDRNRYDTQTGERLNDTLVNGVLVLAPQQPALLPLSPSEADVIIDVESTQTPVVLTLRCTVSEMQNMSTLKTRWSAKLSMLKTRHLAESLLFGDF